jgi:hypothetical protein
MRASGWEEGKAFFLEKKNQKTFASGAVDALRQDCGL